MCCFSMRNRGFAHRYEVHDPGGFLHTEAELVMDEDELLRGWLL